MSMDKVTYMKNTEERNNDNYGNVAKIMYQINLSINTGTVFARTIHALIN